MSGIRTISAEQWQADLKAAWVRLQPMLRKCADHNTKVPKIPLELHLTHEDLHFLTKTEDMIEDLEKLIGRQSHDALETKIADLEIQVAFLSHCVENQIGGNISRPIDADAMDALENYIRWTPEDFARNEELFIRNNFPLS